MLDFAWLCATALLLLSFWQNVVNVVSELDQHTADFKGGSFPLSIVSSYSSCSKKRESGAWRKVSTSPRKKSGRFSSPTWNKPDLSEEGKGAGMRCVYPWGGFRMPVRLMFITMHSTKQDFEDFSVYFSWNKACGRYIPQIVESPLPEKNNHSY